ncbi:hypothetical protein ACQ86N_40220 [Puia sp. P3]|uniref:hypothetical protein n=1 Tax=Puia sp. P3 TaxID=3423952 RepID=UPI003D679EF5
MLSGPETIAEYAIREQSMINSFFGLDLSSTNNQFKSPFLISLQVIYKLAGFPFGQVWLSVVFISFTVFLYHFLRERLHPVLAGLLLLLFLMTPEIFAYTFMILYDYSNMVFFCLGLYFLWIGLSAGGSGSPSNASSDPAAPLGPMDHPSAVHMGQIGCHAACPVHPQRSPSRGCCWGSQPMSVPKP